MKDLQLELSKINNKIKDLQDMTKKTLLLAASIVTVAVGGVSYAALTNTRMPVEFYKGHTHADGVTHGAPQHSGGTNSQGCHNASVPYHCH